MEVAEAVEEDRERASGETAREMIEEEEVEEVLVAVREWANDSAAVVAGAGGSGSVVEGGGEDWKEPMRSRLSELRAPRARVGAAAAAGVEGAAAGEDTGGSEESMLMGEEGWSMMVEVDELVVESCNLGL